ncbi:MAG: low molecular weight protein-tyrosine-phosphatase [Endozoicomonas sp.]
MIRVLFVCLGNICRSPTAHGVFARQVTDAGLEGMIRVDSAGTSGWHENGPPDSRSMTEAAGKGYDLSFIRSRQVLASDFERQDFILAMDRSNLTELVDQCPSRYQYKLGLFLDFVDGWQDREVPDPYYGGGEGFANVLSLVEQGGSALLGHIRQLPALSSDSSE